MSRLGHIDEHLCLGYAALMMMQPPNIQSENCCSTPNAADVLSQEVKARTLAVFKALADSTRLDVFRLIVAQEDEICACDIVDRFDVSQPTIAYHLKVLRNAGLITVSRRGVWAYYAVDPAGLETLQKATEGFAVKVASLV